MDIATPYVAMSMVDTTRDDKSKGNTGTNPETEAVGYARDHVGQLNHNGQVISFGLKMQYGDNFNPYLAVDMVSAKNTTAETKQDHMTIKFGFTGTI